MAKNALSLGSIFVLLIFFEDFRNLDHIYFLLIFFSKFFFKKIYFFRMLASNYQNRNFTYYESKNKSQLEQIMREYEKIKEKNGGDDIVEAIRMAKIALRLGSIKKIVFNFFILKFTIFFAFYDFFTRKNCTFFMWKI